MYKNYVFDLYGTLVDINTDEDCEILWEKLSLFYKFKGADYSPLALNEAYKEKVKKAQDAITNTKYPDIVLEDVFKELFEDKNVYVSKDTLYDTAHLFRVLSIKYIKLYDGVIELLELLKKKGKKIYLLSNAQRIFTLYEMKILGIEKYFDDILFSSDFKVCKPDILFYNQLLEKLKLDKHETIMIGNDYIADIEGAYNFGIDSLYIDSNLSPEINSELKSTYSIMDKDGTVNKIISFVNSL